MGKEWGDKEDFAWSMKASISALQHLIIWWLNGWFWWLNFEIVNYCPILSLSNCQKKALMIITNNYKVNNFNEGKGQIWITLQVPQIIVFYIFNNIFEYLCDNVLCYVRIYILVTTVMYNKSSFIMPHESVKSWTRKQIQLELKTDNKWQQLGAEKLIFSSEGSIEKKCFMMQPHRITVLIMCGCFCNATKFLLSKWERKWDMSGMSWLHYA